MKDYKATVGKIIKGEISELSLDEVKAMVEVPGDEAMGDYAFPCFKLAKTLKKAPPLIAKDIAKALEKNPVFEKVVPVNAYVNMFIDKGDFARETIKTIFEEDEKFGGSEEGKGKTVLVEYSSPNIAKPFHIGHIRSTVIGNAIYKIFGALGYNVVRINHLGDYGTQFGKMICAYRHWGNKEDVEKEPIKTLLEYYTKFHVESDNNPALEQEARDIFAKLEKSEPEEVELWQWFRDESLKEFSRVYEMLGIEFDSYNGESFYSDKMPRFLRELEEKGLLVDSRGAKIVDLEKYGYGIALITKSDGSTLYITRDIAAAVYRKENYDFYKNIYVVASQQNLHFQQWIQIIKLLGYEWAKDCVHVPFGMVSLESGTMSTREGRVVFLEDVLKKAVEKTKEIMLEKNPNGADIDKIAEKIGIGAVMFQELSNNRIKDYVFKWDKVLNFDGETGPYVQYTHARASSIMRKIGKDEVDEAMSMSSFNPKYLVGDAAYGLIKELYSLPEAVKEAGEKYEPSIVTRKVINVAQAFNKFYNKDHVNVDNKEERLAKTALVAATKKAIRNGLNLLGIEAPEKM